MGKSKSSSAVRSVCNDNPLLLGVDWYECIEVESAIESVRSKKEVSGFGETSWCSIEGGDALALGLEERDGDELPKNIDDGGDVFRGRGWCKDNKSWEESVSVAIFVKLCPSLRTKKTSAMHCNQQLCRSGRHKACCRMSLLVHQSDAASVLHAHPAIHPGASMKINNRRVIYASGAVSRTMSSRSASGESRVHPVLPQPDFQ